MRCKDWLSKSPTKTIKITELETENERLNAEISALKSENECKNTKK